MRLATFLGLLVTLFGPWGIAASMSPLAIAAGTAAFAAKVVVLGVALAAGEVFMAKLRLFRVPELLAGSFLIALLAVGASWFMAAA
jgi:formate hydrogenlyase subunit 4